MDNQSAMAQSLKAVQKGFVANKPDRNQPRQTVRTLIGEIRHIALYNLPGDHLEDIGQRLLDLAAECFEMGDESEARKLASKARRKEWGRQ